ncbi:phytoene dehydrogenase-like protein [Nocardioides daedukensis]|uniref:Phytoene dehydrogenase-like protein n=1 Tax=Nocardioides daedukensis TaxID=634462 RepID=A0A7Y9UVV2_9ACTN|nr:NAD(P)/FAD-dependent oxidoreductase [Nocardioides daedukensis]NYG59130.1 phytoene dehydrogenase-like protein [Nocardioides daedukensis]
MSRAVVVGSGPNGLAAAITLAQRGVEVLVLEASDRVGGGTLTSEVTVPGLLHDECAAFHPTGVASPFFQSLGLEEFGLRWIWPEVQLAHPLDGGRAALMWRDVARTAHGLGVDGPAWDRLIGRSARNFDALAQDVFRPILHVPRHPFKLAHFGLNSLLPAPWAAKRFSTEEARALFTGVAAHKFGTLTGPLASSVGVMLAAAAHAYGWPVAEGGTESITRALVAKLEQLGGRIETGVRVTSRADLAAHDVLLLDTAPDAAARILGDELPGRTRRAYRRYTFGPGAFKVDYAIEGDIPWQNPHVGKAGTVHVGGTMEELVSAGAMVARGEMPERPFVLLGQQYVADPTRSAGASGLNPIYAYAHVPHAWPGDATDAITAQIERFAPGFRERIRQVHVRDTRGLEAHNANYVGGDIAAGANTAKQIVMRPRISVDPYATGIPGVYLCSSATPPGAGVHGMGGHNAANAALTELGA